MQFFAARHDIPGATAAAAGIRGERIVCVRKHVSKFRRSRVGNGGISTQIDVCVCVRRIDGWATSEKPMYAYTYRGEGSEGAPGQGEGTPLTERVVVFCSLTSRIKKLVPFSPTGPRVPGDAKRPPNSIEKRFENANVSSSAEMETHCLRPTFRRLFARNLKH